MSGNVGNIESFNLPRNYFPLNKKKIGTYKTGKIYPVYSEYLMPGDTIKLRIENVTRQMPTQAPSYSNYTLTYRTFFVALRNLWSKFPEWLTGYKQYDKTQKFEEDVPRWNVSNIKYTQPGTLWNALGFPYDCIPDVMPADFKRQAYAYIYDRYFRYQPFQESILTEGEPGTWTGEELLTIIRDRDYFTTMLPYQQLADPIALPITGDTSAVWTDTSGISALTREAAIVDANGKFISGGQQANQGGQPIPNQYYVSVNGQPTGGLKIQKTVVEIKGIEQTLNNNKISLENISSVTMSMLRQAVQLQLFAEMLARTGVYYDDVLNLNWGTAPSDETLGYPVYIGGNKVNLITSEVLQTSATQDTQPLGQLGGHGLGVAESGEMTYTVKEFGVVMTVMYIKTDNLYSGQGMETKDLFLDNLSLPWIMLQHLSEQPVPKRELYCKSTKKPNIATENSRITIEGPDDPTAKAYNNDILAYREVFDNWRYTTSTVFGSFCLQQRYIGGTKKETYNNYNWTQAIFFDTDKPPAMNEDFLEFREDNRNYTIVESTEEGQIDDAKLELDTFYVWTNIQVDCWRVMDLFGTPGRLDHVI